MTDSPAWDPNAKYTSAADFDGVIHSYTSPWVSAETIPDPPVPGAIEWLNEISKTFRVVIFTTRGKEPEGRIAVAEWLTDHGYQCFPKDVTALKPPALVYVDDRAFRFDGTNFPSVGQLQFDLVPWNKRPMGLKA